MRMKKGKKVLGMVLVIMIVALTAGCEIGRAHV